MQRRLLLIFMLMLVVAASAYAQVGRQQRNQAAISRAGLSIRQQAEEHAREFWNSRITKCGSTYYTQSSAYVYQLLSTRIEVTHHTVSTADRLNGIEYVGSTNYYVGQSRRYSERTTLYDNPGWSAWSNGFSSVASAGLEATIQLEHGRWRITPLSLSEATGLKPISCSDGANPKQLFERRKQEALKLTDIEMFKSARNWGIYVSEDPPIPLEMLRALYWATKNYKSPNADMGPNGAWLISYGSTGMQSMGLPSNLLERAKKTGLPNWVEFTPTGGWIYEANVLAYENIPQTLIDALAKLSTNTDSGMSLAQDFSIVSIAFGPQDSWVMIYDDKQSRFNDSTHDHSRVRRYDCYCGKNIQEILQDNIDNGTDPKQFVFLGNNGWLLLRGKNGFASENVPADLYKVLDEVTKTAPTIGNVVVAPNGAWLVMTRSF